MVVVNNQLEIQFRLPDGSDIGPILFLNTTTVHVLKQTVLAQWPIEKDNGPRTVKELKLISSGKVLENNKRVKDSMSPVCDPSGSVITMHVVLKPRISDEEKKMGRGGNKWFWFCFGRRY